MQDRIALLSERLADYGCGVHRCGRDGIAAAIGAVLGQRGRTDMVASGDLPREWLPDTVRTGADLSYRELDRVGGVITRCSLAIAQTGTIVLEHDAHTPRALTLIPDYHLCVLFAEQVVELVPEAMRRMAGFAERPITTISGPSATSDIEMTRVAGVHGPRTLDVLIVK
ncbi:MAG TPA: LUD domain-containing protein [Bryobacteraceae bacterium]|nr:LUD domain-containing protein [Bryobacteraceae bacterium]